MMKIISTLVTLFALSIVAIGQVGGVLRGSVHDQNNAIVVRAKVTLRGNKVLRQQFTDSQGNFEFNNLSGNYELIIDFDGFNQNKQSVQVNTGESKTVDVQLSISSKTLTVTAETGRTTEKDTIPQAVNVISTEELAQRANPVLSKVAGEGVGVNVQRTSPTIGGIFIRGLAGKNVSVYSDGVRYTTSVMRAGISSFFNLNDQTSLRTVELLRGTNSAQYGSDSLGGTVNLISRTPTVGLDQPAFNGEFSTGYTTSDNSFGGNLTLGYSAKKYGFLVNTVGRRVNNLRAPKGLDPHAAVTRFLGLRSDILGKRLNDTAFTQYGGNFHFTYAPSADQQISVRYQRGQQDGGKRYDQLQGGDGNLIADLRNLINDFGYVRYVKQNLGFFDNGSFTASYNSQREERVNQGGQGNPTGAITHQYERTRALGGSFFLSKAISNRNDFLVGGDLYHEKVIAPAFTVNPVTNVAVLSRPRVPNGATYLIGGVFVQDTWIAIAQKLRFSGALRYNGVSYVSKASNSPIVGGVRLFPDDSLKTGDFSGRIGAVVTPVEGLNFAFNYSRGFRAPNITDLGTLGLTGDGFEADFTSASALGGRIGTTADASAISTGLNVQKQRSETTNNYDFSIRYRNARFQTNLTAFQIDFQNAVTKQTLILPAGSVGRSLGTDQIISQNANGAVFVAAAGNPVLIRANFTTARIRGLEYELEARLLTNLLFAGNFTYLRAEDQSNGRPPNIEGGTPPTNVFLRVRYEPTSKTWFEVYSTLADRQNRLSTLDLGDRRGGAIRSRAQIQNYFRRGACVNGLVSNPDRVCGTGDEAILLATGETLAQVQNRLLGTAGSAPLFTYLPGYGIVGFRGGYRINDKNDISFDFENIGDKGYRNVSWGIEGGGRSINLRYRYKF